MASKRQLIVDALVDVFKQIDGTGAFQSDLFNNVHGKLIFWDDVQDWPTVSVVSGPERRQYLPGDFKWGFLTINIRVYVNGENPKDLLEAIFSDIEVQLDANNNLTIDSESECTDIRIVSISDDEGLLAPMGVGEISLQVQYAI